MISIARLKTLDVAIKSASIFRCTPDWSLDSAWAGRLIDYDLWYIWGGVGRMTTSDGVIDLYPGRGLWMRPGRRYEATHDPKTPLRVTFVHFNLRNKTRILRPAEFVPPLEVFDVTAHEFFTATLAHIVHLRAQGGMADIAVSIFKALLLEILSARQPEQETALQRHYKLTLNPIIALIHDQPGRRFTIPELAAKTGYTADHFVRLFRSVTGQSPKEFMIAQRIDRARALLKESSHTVTQIADQLGYEDLGFFSRQFKAQVGLSPDHYRRRGMH